MPDEVIVRQCSPTLAGLKTANLFPVNYESPSEINRDIRSLNKRLMSKGLRLLPMKYGSSKALLYMYRPAKLRADLACAEASQILESMGYCADCPERCLAQLIKKINSAEQFPHEVGLFLGYPPEDVRGFIQNKACGCKCIGCWKVYGNEKEAQKTFCKYKMCTRSLTEQWEKGKSIEQLAVTA